MSHFEVRLLSHRLLVYGERATVDGLIGYFSSLHYKRKQQQQQQQRQQEQMQEQEQEQEQQQL